MAAGGEAEGRKFGSMHPPLPLCLHIVVVNYLSSEDLTFGFTLYVFPLKLG
jgi:hypothetical protein